MQDNLIASFRCSICFIPAKAGRAFFKSTKCNHRFCENCLSNLGPNSPPFYFTCKCTSSKREQKELVQGLHEELENFCDQLKPEKCHEHDNSKKTNICLNTKCKHVKKFCCLECLTSNHSKCDLKQVFSAERFLKYAKPYVGNAFQNMLILRRLSEENDFEFDGYDDLKKRILKEINMLINIDYDFYQEHHSQISVNIIEELFIVKSVFLENLDNLLNKIKFLCENYVPLSPVNVIFEEISALTQVNVKFERSKHKHVISLLSENVPIEGKFHCCLCEENPDKKVNVIKNLSNKIHEKMENMIEVQPQFLLTIDKDYRIDLKNVTQWSNEFVFLKDNQASIKQSLEMLNQRMMVHEKNQATKIAREEIINQKLLQMEKIEVARSSEFSKINKKVEILASEVNRLTMEKTMSNNQIGALTQQANSLNQDKVKLRNDVTHLTEELHKNAQQKKVMNDVMTEMNKAIDQLEISNKNLKSQIDFLKKSIKHLNPAFNFLMDSSLEQKYANFFKDSTFLNANHFSFFNDILPGVVDVTLLYNSKRHGEEAAKFHQKCDYKGSTIVIIRSGVYISGGFTDQDWESTDVWKFSQTSFLFSFNKSKKYPIKKDQVQHAIGCQSSKGPVFGGNNDIYVSEDITLNGNMSNLGVSYEPLGSESPHTELFGSRNFNIDEYEVYQVKFK